MGECVTKLALSEVERGHADLPIYLQGVCVRRHRESIRVIRSSPRRSCAKAGS